MIRLLFFAASATCSLYAQFGAAKSVINGTGAPNAALCASANNVGKVYARKDGAATGSTFYVCANTAASTYAWELAGTGSGVSAGTGINVVGSTVSVDTATILTRERGQSGADMLCSDSGGDDAYVCTLEYAPPSYVAGMCLNLKVTTTNTGAATVDANTLGAKTIKTASGGTLTDGDIIVGQINRICYDGTDFRTGGGGTSVAAAAPYVTIAGANYLPFGFAATLPPTSGWTARNFSTATFTTSGLGGAIAITSTTTNNSLNIQGRAIGSTTTLIAVVAGVPIANGTSNVSRCGVGIQRPAGSLGEISYGFRAATQTVPPIIGGGYRWTNPTTPNTGFTGSTGGMLASWPVTYFRVTLSGGNVAVAFSPTGIDWVDQSSDTQTNVLGGAATSTDEWIFYGAGDGTGTARCTLLSWSAA